ncbi:hypothetical protein D3C77_339370 [compost metagenome]
MRGQGLGVGKFQVQPRRTQAAQRPFAHGLAGVVVVGRHQRIGAGPAAQPFQGAIELLRAAVAHVLHDLFADPALKRGDARGGVAEGFFRGFVQGCAGAVRTFVLAAKLQFAGVRLGDRLALVVAGAGLEFFDPGVVTLRWNQAGGLRGRAEQGQGEQGRGRQFADVHGVPHCPACAVRCAAAKLLRLQSVASTFWLPLSGP